MESREIASGPNHPQPQHTAAFNNWSTYGYDNARDGFNPNTADFTPASLSKLHLAWGVRLNDYDTQTQPILATKVGSHAGLLIVGGALGNLYAYDALTGSLVWQQPLGNMTHRCGDNIEFGIGGTPVYDPSSGSLFASSMTGNDNVTQMFVNELSISNGALRARVNIAPNQLPGETNLTHTSLTLANGMIYAGTGSSCDYSSWRGSVVAVNERSMTLANTFYTTYNQPQAGTPVEPYSGGGVWGWGGVSIDPKGDVWAATGNADLNQGSQGPQPPFVQTRNEHAAFGEHVLQLSPNLTTAIQNNYPGFTFGGDAKNLDISGTPVLSKPLNCHTMAAVQGKSGTLYIYDTEDASKGPVASYKFSAGSYSNPNLGNPGFSPITGLYYAGVTPDGVLGTVELSPGMVAIAPGGLASGVIWRSAAFGPASSPRSMPTITAGNVVFVGTKCYLGSVGGCGVTSAYSGGALWALDARTGAILNGGYPVVVTASTIRMGAVVDGDWLYLLDNGGDFYALTLDSSYPAITNPFLKATNREKIPPAA